MEQDGVEALLFDLGQVVIEVDFSRAFEIWAGHEGCSAAAVAGRFSQDEAYCRHETGEFSVAEYFESLRSSLGIGISDAQFAEGWNSILIGEMPGISDLLDKAAETLPVYAFSNTNPTHIAHWSVHFSELMGRFREVFVSSSLGLRKPDVAAYDRVVSEIGVAAPRVLFFDDVAENVAGARRAGLEAVHVTTPQCVGRELKDRFAF